MTSVKKIVADYLKSHGFDGLYNELGECGCGLNDLMPCMDNSTGNCEPAHQVYCPCCGEDIFVPIRFLEQAHECIADKLKEGNDD